jgi:CHAD domain-containing protein
MGQKRSRRVSTLVRKPPATLSQIIGRRRRALRLQVAAALRTGSPESIHNVRVCTRRLQTALELVPKSGDKNALRSAKARLRRVRRALSALRNYDVFLSILDDSATRAPARQRERLGLLRALLEERRKELARESRRTLEEFDLEPSPLRVETAGVSARAAKQLIARITVFEERIKAGTNWSAPRAVHRIRIATKRLRYLLEVLTELGYGESKAALKWLRTAQTRIGAWHDLRALEDEVVRLVGRKRYLRGRLREAAELLQAASLVSRRREKLAAASFPLGAPSRFRPALNRILARLGG